MKLLMRAAAAAASVVAFAVPAPAQAAPTSVTLAAVTELNAAGKPVAYPVKPGETGKAVLGVVNLADEPLAGVVVEVRVLNDMDLPRVYTNCQYYVDANVEGAWCEFDRELVKGETVATDFAVAAAPSADPANWSRVITRWFPKSYADERGGIAKLAELDNVGASKPGPGTGGGAVTLAPRPLPIPAAPSGVGFTDLKLMVTRLAALNARDAAGKPLVYPISRGETIGLNLGVANLGTAPAEGVVLRVRAYDDLDLPRLFTNCQYYVDANLEGAWCEFPQTVPADRSTYALTQFKVAATADAEAKTTKTTQVEWFPKEWSDRQGGIAEIAKKHSGQGTTPAAGTESALTLTPAEMTIPAETSHAIFVHTNLVTTPSSPTPAPSSSGPAIAAPGTPEELVITGSATTAVVAVGGALVLAGVLGLVVARRRRTSFTA
ncbi:hypothetical protein [Paractinoplanes rishiriensis]|uniref:Gram-positive cocci surface proteins LPxTG domain-containing protein n=1 Tax=Paractinoplanes rishiriensis TaxID=1050105 RepID=A0A919JZI4_9ACTN|nr:hypothetical protein [Actinoplanes rishiriensis]GIE96569.1 hypothetical protein Ari01nite_40340 [Actinoplanes rishiriensis]